MVSSTQDREVTLEEAFAEAYQHQVAGRYQQAVSVYEQILQVLPDHVDTLNNLGVLLGGMKNINGSIACFRKLLALKPDDVKTLVNLGAALKGGGQLQESEYCFREALKIQPDLVEALVNLAVVLSEQQLFEEAERLLHDAVALDGNRGEIYNHLGNLYLFQGDTTQAESYYRTALEKGCATADTYNNLCVSLDNDQVSEKMAFYRQAIAQDGNPCQLYRHLVGCKHYESVDDADINAMKELLDAPWLTDEDQMHLHFALGKAYDDCDVYDLAFKHFRAGNVIRHQTHQLPREEITRYVDACIDFFTKERFSSLPFEGSPSTLPVFIVGTPRSGKTLVESLLKGHPALSDGGEMLVIQNIVDQLKSHAAVEEFYLESLPHLTQGEVDGFVQPCLDRMARDVTADTMRVLMTFPYNYYHLGLISALFPQAKIIHCRRNRDDACLYNYFKYFIGDGYSFDWGDVQYFYDEYERLMAHWKKVLPINMLEVSYEQLVSEPQIVLDGVFDYLAVNKDSYPGVQRELYDREVGRYQYYATFISELSR